MTSVMYPRCTGGKHVEHVEHVEHVIRNALAVRNNEALGTGQGVSNLATRKVFVSLSTNESKAKGTVKSGNIY